MNETLPTIHQEHLLKLEPFCRGLAEALGRAGLAPDMIEGTMRASVSAECIQCGIRVSGEELYALSQPPSPELASAKIGRLRLGDCARQGCDSYYYKLAFQNHPGLDWPKLLAQIQSPAAEEAKPNAPTLELKAATKLVASSIWARRLGIALAALVVLLLVRQWHSGGRIPLIREPEHFRIATDPNEGHQH
jgi:hypothetical protein